MHHNFFFETGIFPHTTYFFFLLPPPPPQPPAERLRRFRLLLPRRGGRRRLLPEEGPLPGGGRQVLALRGEGHLRRPLLAIVQCDQRAGVEGN